MHISHTATLVLIDAGYRQITGIVRWFPGQSIQLSLICAHGYGHTGTLFGIAYSHIVFKELL